MNRRTTLCLIVGLLGARVSVLGSSGVGRAQGSDIDKIKGNLDAFSAALDALDIRKMEDCWAHDARAMYIGPRDKTITTGWDAVKKKLEGIVEFWSELKHTTQEGPYIHQNEGTAWADIRRRQWHVRFVPKADSCAAANRRTTP
jgi:hypothetical protein